MTRTIVINSVKLSTLNHGSSTIDLHSQQSKLKVYKEQLFSLHSPSSSTASLTPSPIQLTQFPNFKTPLFQPRTPPRYAIIHHLHYSLRRDGFLALPTIGAPSPNIEARSAELDARANEILEARAAALVCQFGGVKACSAECVAKGKLHGGYCNSHE